MSGESEGSPPAEDRPPLRAWARVGLGAVALVALVAIAVVIVTSWSVSGTTQTFSRTGDVEALALTERTETEGRDLPETMLLALLGVALVLGLEAASGGRLHASLGGVGVRDEIRRKAEREVRSEVKRELRDQAEDVLEEGAKPSVGVHPSPADEPAQGDQSDVQPREPQAPTPHQESALELAARLYATASMLGGDEPPYSQDRLLERIAERAIVQAGFDVVREPGVGGVRPDLLVTLPDGTRVAVETRSLGSRFSRSSDELSHALAQVGVYREALGADFGMLVVPDRTNLPAAVAPPRVLVASLNELEETLRIIASGRPPGTTPE